MACSCLRVTPIWAEDLKDANFFRILRSMNPYVIVSLCDGVKLHEEKQCSPVHKDGGTDPRWDHPFSFTVDGAAARAGRLKLKFEIKAEKTLWSDREVGSVEVPVKKLLDQPGGDGEWKVATYDVWLPSGKKTKGVLKFSYQFGVLEAAGAPPAERPPTPPMHGAAPYCPPQGYPPQGYPPQGYPPHGYPPQGYPPQGPPPQGYPPQGYPPQGYPPQGYPPQGYASHPQGHGHRLGGLLNPGGLLAGLNAWDALEGAVNDAGTSGAFDV